MNVKRIQNFLFRHVYLFIITIIVLSLYFLSIADSGYIGIDLLVTNLQGRFAISVVLILLMAVLGLAKNRFNITGFFKGFVSGWPLLLIGVLYFIVLLTGTNFSTYFIGVNVIAIVAIIFDMFCTGLFEEVLMRGVVFQSLTEKMGKDRQGNMKSMILSSFLFGLIHLLNYSEGLLIATVSQVLFTFFIGMFLCSIFIRSGRNLWVVIALHAVFDFTTLILQQRFVYNTAPGNPATDMSLLMGIIIVAATFPLGLLGVINVKNYYKSSGEVKV